MFSWQAEILWLFSKELHWFFWWWRNVSAEFLSQEDWWWWVYAHIRKKFLWAGSLLDSLYRTSLFLHGISRFAILIALAFIFQLTFRYTLFTLVYFHVFFCKRYMTGFYTVLTFNMQEKLREWIIHQVIQRDGLIFFEQIILTSNEEVHSI